MFLIAKTALVTCAFYVGIAILLEALLLGVTHWKGTVFFSINFKAWAFIFGLIWLVSFALAWRITIFPSPRLNPMVRFAPLGSCTSTTLKLQLPPRRLTPASHCQIAVRIAGMSALVGLQILYAD